MFGNGALLWRHSPTYPRRSSPSSTSALLRTCSSCSVTARVLPVPPPPSPSASSRRGTSPSSFPTHDHPTLFVRAAGFCTTQCVQRARSAGVGVSFALHSRYNLSESIPREIAVADLPIRRQPFSVERAEVFAAIRALDRVKGVLGAATAQRRDNKGLGGKILGEGGEEATPRVGEITFPAKVEEVVVLTRSDYLISGITCRTKPWRRTASVKSHKRLGSTSSTSTSASSSSGSSDGRSWLLRKGSQPKASDFDLFAELDLLVGQIEKVYGARVCFHKATVNEAQRLAREGAALGADA